MAVRRVSATLARNQELPYTTFLNSTIELIKNPDALAVYTYLQTKAEHWIVRREDVMSRFSIGKHRYTEAMSHLRQLGLVERAVTRDSAGKVTDNQLIIHYAPNDLSSGLRVSGNPDELDSGESGHLETDQSFKNKSMDSNNTIGTSADAPCSECVGLGYHGLPDDKCQHCNGTGKEPNTDQPSKPEKVTLAPAKQKKPTKAQALFNLVRENPEQWPALNSVDDNILIEWAKLRTRKGASSEQRALNTIEKTLQELRTVHGIAPDTALAAQCDAGWATVKVEYLVKNRPNMSYAGNQQQAQNRPRQDAQKTFKRASEVDSESLSNGKNAISNLKGLI